MQITSRTDERPRADQSPPTSEQRASAGSALKDRPGKARRKSSHRLTSERHFIVIGSMKSGTTTLYQHLVHHPDIGMSRMKETDYFIACKNFPLGFSWYRRQFPAQCRVSGEISPNYSKHDVFPGVPRRIAEVLPETRLVFVARDPVDRFVSHYRHSVLMGHCSVSPAMLLKSSAGAHMLETSRYTAQLETYLKHFSREQLLILDFDQLRLTPQVTLDRLTDFLDLPPHPVGEAATHNDAASIARMPRFVQRLWRSRMMRRIDPLISRDMRDRARDLMSRGPARSMPDFPDALRAEVAERLADEAQAFRKLSGQDFQGWCI
ncbi:sulfotransferase family protein [Sulfitobacter aestuarii]|uniref:Sulfotransferase family protein n=1 Tax=Sulfitobacter aestuarii TaxID=2161676 RepID=A0ABW5U2D1_9RHOB